MILSFLKSLILELDLKNFECLPWTSGTGILPPCSFLTRILHFQRKFKIVVNSSHMYLLESWALSTGILWNRNSSSMKFLRLDFFLNLDVINWIWSSWTFVPLDILMLSLDWIDEFLMFYNFLTFCRWVHLELGEGISPYLIKFYPSLPSWSWTHLGGPKGFLERISILEEENSFPCETLPFHVLWMLGRILSWREEFLTLDHFFTFQGILSSLESAWRGFFILSQFFTFLEFYILGRILAHKEKFWHFWKILHY